MNDRNTPFEGFDRLFENMFQAMGGPAVGSAGGADRYGTVRTERTDEGYVVLADLPGFEREDVDVRFVDGILTIEAATDTETGGVSRHRHTMEQVRVPGDVDAADVTARLRNGVLEVTFPMESDADDHYIQIE